MAHAEVRGVAPGRRAWNAYWWTLAAWALAFGLYLELGRTTANSVVWAIVVALPLFIAGVNLVLFSRSHEAICAIEVARHEWLRLMTMGGYSRGAFTFTGLVAIAMSVPLGIVVASR